MAGPPRFWGVRPLRMLRSSTRGVSGLDASSDGAIAEGPGKKEPRRATELQASEPIRHSKPSKIQRNQDDIIKKRTMKGKKDNKERKTKTSLRSWETELKTWENS